jgi:hypothetical protein
MANMEMLIERNILIKGSIYVNDENSHFCHFSCNWIATTGRVKTCALFSMKLVQMQDGRKVFTERCPACWEAERIYNETKSLLDMEGI